MPDLLERSHEFMLPDHIGDGIYQIKNIHTGLMLSLGGERARDGEVIRICHAEDTTAQQVDCFALPVTADEFIVTYNDSKWILKNQRNLNNEVYVSIQSANKDHGFFAPKIEDSGQKVMYTHKQTTIALTHGANQTFRIADARDPHLVLGVYGLDEPEVRLFNENEGDGKQHWEFIQVNPTNEEEKDR